MEQITREGMIGLLQILADLPSTETKQGRGVRRRVERAIAALQAAEPVQGEVVYRCAFCEHVYIEPVSRCDCLEHGVEQRWERWIITPEFCPPAKAQVPELLKESGPYTYDAHERGFVQGWNSCRKAMLTASPAPDQSAKNHNWDDVGERCLDCGGKDWFAGTVCEGKQEEAER